ncbi:hypothetical protein BDZ90DRAFT_232692 [Jaminaea rosea]|uniref:Raptor N-terminal CASPase-like domain-containing protein n=1 Tax=Jaminaea rosea TaxID=1569628 RepID=A0A316UTA6_9BASI|nr:hypothetical protein BDZ90DRAFT_232692 [Jaminaea rosea]PWN27133.1 hypothetical protein BDZ90DRAFT_232692 [Jaminaea rosea]
MAAATTSSTPTSASNGLPHRQAAASPYNAAAGPSSQRSSSTINGGGGDARMPSSSSQRPSRATSSHARDPRNLSIMSDHHFLPQDGGGMGQAVQSPTTLQPYEVDGNGVPSQAYYNGHHGDEPEDSSSIRDEDEEEDDDDDDDDLSTTSGGRHGNLLRPEPEDYVVTESPYMTHWFSKRHLTGGNPKPRSRLDLPDWRMRERLRTVTAALVMCLNIGVDPPDVSKTNPCSKLICWMDPSSLEVSKALPAIGKNLQAQFETLSMKTRYKQYLDPIVEETKRFCTALRRTAKDERVLFYYNGFGVPKPTPGGEIWVFNKAYTQYIPVTLYDLQAWLGNPCIFVWDASAAGNVVVNFKKLAERRAEEEAKINGGASSSVPRPGADGEHFPLRESIHLAACGPDEILPMNPDLPADLFTCCLTSPIEISLRWFVLQNPLPSKLNVDMVMNIPGRLQDRRTPLGELNWIFTAITDTIAWTVLPRNIFRRLFRDDLMVAALLRNFLLAERIMRFYHCTPMSHPKLPPTHNHPLWNSWDLAVDQCLAQLPTLLEKEKAQRIAEEGGPPVEPKLAAFEYRHSTFFSEQLKAFEVWLSQGGVSRQGRRRRADAHVSSKQSHEGTHDLDAAEEDEEEADEEGTARQLLDPPDQLPIVLQVLLSQVHRLRALILLSQFLDLGPRAVNLALSIGIFPYVLKLLQSPAVDLKPVLIYIWARILAVDRSCQNDLLRDSGFVYFVGVLSPFAQGNGGGAAGGQGGASLPIPNVSEHRAMCAFILSVFCQDFPAGQQACLQQTDAMDSCLEHLEDDDFLLRQWSALCLAQLWDGSDEGKAMGIRKDAHGKLCYMLGDVSPEVRAAVLYALSTLLGASGSSVDPFDPVSSMSASGQSSSSRSQSGGNTQRHRCLGTGSALDLDESAQRSLEIGIAIAMLSTRGDCSPMVRKELVIALSAVVREYKGFFVLAAYLYYDDEETRLRSARKKERESAKRSSMGGLGVVEELTGATEAMSLNGGSDDGSSAANKGQDALLARVLSKLALEEGLTEEDIANVPAFSTLFVSLLDLSVDGYTEVAAMAKTVVDYILALLLESEVARASESIVRRFGAAGQGASSRVVLPTSVHGGGASAAEDSYFSYNPRSSDGVSASESLVSPHGTAFGPHGSTRHAAPHPRRAPSLAQTVKAIATLGYSRPASPVPSPESRSPGEGSPATYSPASAPRVPAPRFNVMGYQSPYVSGSDGHQAASRSGATTPTSPSSSSAAALLAKRSASAESLAHIARRANANAASSNNANSGGTTTPGANAGEQRGSAAGSTTDSPDDFYRPSADVQVGDALAALISVDLQRFRNRASLASGGTVGGNDNNAFNNGTPGSGLSSAGSTPLPSPSTSRTAMKHLLSDPGLGNDDILDTLPLKSRLFGWCSEYYREPQMKPAESEEPGSVKYNVQTWKRQRNERIVAQSQVQVDAAFSSSSASSTPGGKGQAKWTQPVSTLRSGAPPYSMVMHQFEPHLVTASERDVVSVWDWERARLLSRFHNGNARGTNITSTLFINEEVDGLLLVGSAEGDVRIYRNYDRPTWIPGTRGPNLISTFRALPDLVRSRFPSGLICDWQQSTGHLLAGGDSRVLRIWDAHRELCVCDIPTRTSSPVTSLSSESDVGHIFVAGFGNGTVAVYDRRNPPEASLVRLWEEHGTWVHNVHLQKRGNRELVSASDDGEVRLWDIRGRSSISRASLGGQLRGKLSGFAVHERAPVFAAVSTPRAKVGAGGAVHGAGPHGVQGVSATPQQVLLGAFADPTKSLTTWTRHFASSQGVAAGHGGSHHHHGHHGHHGGPTSAHQAATSTTSTLPGALLDSPLTNFSPAMGSVALHPHWPLVAYAGPDVAGTIEVKRMPEDAATAAAAAAAAGEGGAATDPAAAQGEVALPSFDQLFKGANQSGDSGSKRRSWIRI